VPDVGFLTTKGHRDSIFIVNVEGRYLGRSPHELQHVLAQDKGHYLLPNSTLLRQPDETYMPDPVFIRLSSDVGQPVIALVDDMDSVHSTHPVDLWDPTEEVTVYELPSGRRLDAWHDRMSPRKSYALLAAPDLELMAPVRLNVICFRFRPPAYPEAGLDELNRRLGSAVLADGRAYFGTTVYRDHVAFRPAISNWRTTGADADLIVEVARELGSGLLARA